MNSFIPFLSKGNNENKNSGKILLLRALLGQTPSQKTAWGETPPYKTQYKI